MTSAVDAKKILLIIKRKLVIIVISVAVTLAKTILGGPRYRSVPKKIFFFFNLFLVAAANVMPSQTFDISLIVVTLTIDSICSYFVLLVANWLFLYFFQNTNLHAATGLIRFRAFNTNIFIAGSTGHSSNT